MAVTPQYPVPVSPPVGAAIAYVGSGGTDLELYREKFRRRLPDSLDELHGPAEGVVEPPATVVWSGLRVFDLANERQRMSLYRTVLAEGMREDLSALLNRNILLRSWPTLPPVPLMPFASRPTAGPPGSHSSAVPLSCLVRCIAGSVVG